MPEDDHVRYYLIELYLYMGQTLMAETELDHLLERYTEAPHYALAALGALVETFPEEPLVVRRLAQHLAAAGEPSKAIELLDALGERLLEGERKGEAVRVIEDIIALEPPQVDEYRRLLMDLHESMSGEIARDSFEGGARVAE
jgi:hypothetical protein